MISIYNRIKTKLSREIKGYYRSKTQFQKEMTFTDTEDNWYEPVLAGPSTFVQDCTCAETVKNVNSILKKLEADKYIQFNIEYYNKGIERFGNKWVYADINTVLYGIAKNINIESYLEIGVRRGRSMSIVAAMHPDARLIGFDMWIQNYVGIENPGPEFVHDELKRVGYNNRAEFITGDSKKTVPVFFKDNPNLFFDVITVDGDHSRKGAEIDLKNVIPRLKVGGFLVFDDISNPSHTHLEKVWQNIIADNKRFMSYSFKEVGYGIAFAIKKY
jgi:predicted O-methyltransferase YrrM